MIEAIVHVVENGLRRGETREMEEKQTSEISPLSITANLDFTPSRGQEITEMAPYQSLLPVRKHKVPPSGLPRLKPSSSSTSINNAPPAPPRPLESTQSRVQEDVSVLDFGNLLGGPGDEEGFGLLNDEEVPDFLVDQSMWTVGGRTPARKGQEQASWDLIDEEEVEEEDDAGIAQYGQFDSLAPLLSFSHSYLTDLPCR